MKKFKTPVNKARDEEWSRDAELMLEEASRADRRKVAREILEVIISARNAKQAGQRAFCLAHALKLSGVRTQKDLARRMKLTPTRVCQILHFAKSEYDRIMTRSYHR